MAYEEFKRSGGRAGSPTISVVPDGRIALNASAARLLSGAGVKHVVLLWDKAHNKMAMKGSTKGGNSYAVSIAANSGSLRAKTFMAHIGWAAEARVALPAEWNEKEKMLEIPIADEFLASSAKKKGK